ncbi:MAG: inositol monophosphatase [Actinomycetota bacterium]|nr:inositol monophosphatase [Actinomycetota bacterium]
MAVTIAVEAAELVRATREAAIADIDTKSTPTDVVTAADRAAEDLIRARVAELRPDDDVLGEEAGGAKGSGVTWVVDPIDGTVNYLYGLPWYAVSIGVEVDGEAVAGAVVEPASGRRWSAAKGQGAWLDGTRLHCSSPVSLELTLLASGFGYQAARREFQAGVLARMAGSVRDVRRSGSAALELVSVAAGWVDAYYERWLGPWDYSAGALIAREAGARVWLPGECPQVGADAVLVAAPSIAEPLRDVLVKAGAGSYE